MSKRATLSELKSTWTLEDLDKANALIDMEESIKAQEEKRK